MHHCSEPCTIAQSHAPLLQVLSECVSEENIKASMVYPPLRQIADVSFRIAVAIVTLAYEQGLAGVYPEPRDKADFVRLNMYTADYESFLPQFYEWPQEAVTVPKEVAAAGKKELEALIQAAATTTQHST
jgi:hypothetical protein